MRGAGGTEGGVGRFLLGLVMFVGGGYLFLRSIQVTTDFGFGYGLYRFGWGSVTTGMILIPFIFGVGLIFYKSNNLLGWFLAGGSLVAMVFGILMSLRLHIMAMSAYELLSILVLTFGGLGLFLSSLRDFSRSDAS